MLINVVNNFLIKMEDIVMAKTKIRMCKNCGGYTEQIYKGRKAKDKERKEFDKFAYVMTCGMFFVADKICDDRPKFWKCTDCGKILLE